MSEEVTQPSDEADEKFDYDIASPTKSRLPAIFQEATWLCTTPFDDATERVGLGFNIGGEKVRLRLDLTSALDIVATLAEALSAYQRRRSHSDTSSGMPSSEVSTPDDGEKV